jgi:hypothetical protein
LGCVSDRRFIFAASAARREIVDYAIGREREMKITAIVSVYVITATSALAGTLGDLPASNPIERAAKRACRQECPSEGSACERCFERKTACIVTIIRDVGPYYRKGMKFEVTGAAAIQTRFASMAATAFRFPRCNLTAHVSSPAIMINTAVGKDPAKKKPRRFAPSEFFARNETERRATGRTKEDGKMGKVKGDDRVRIYDSSDDFHAARKECSRAEFIRSCPVRDDDNDVILAEQLVTEQLVTGRAYHFAVIDGLLTVAIPIGNRRMELRKLAAARAAVRLLGQNRGTQH